MKLSLRTQLLIALVIPAAAVALIVVGWAEAISGRALESALADRLVSVAGVAAESTSPRVLALGQGDDETRTARNAHARLEGLRAAAGVDRLVVADLDDEVLVDTRGELPIGAPYRRAVLDRAALDAVGQGRAAAAPLFEGPEGRLFKSAYAPMRENGEVVAWVAAAAPVAYGQALAQLRERILAVGAMGVLVVAGLAVWMARRLARPLARLSDSAEAIGAGALDTPISEAGPREAAVLARTMREMASSLRAREEELQMMLAGIAHEVRNPLGGIELFGGLLKEDLEGDPRRAHVDKILKELGVLSRVVNDFLSFAREEALELQSVDLEDLLLEATALAAAAAETKAVRLERVSPPGSARLDRDGMQRALLNLIQNGIQAAPEGGTVRVTAEATVDGVRFLVEDDGPGVPPEKWDQIFRPFFTTRQKGTGLGLSLVRKTALAHRGTTAVEASPMGGARFVIELPSPPEDGHGHSDHHR